MNRLSTLLVVALTTLSIAGFSQQKKKKVEGEEPPVKRLANIISYRVMIKDTASLVTIAQKYGSVAEYNKANAGHYMVPDVAEKFTEALSKLNPTEKVIVTDSYVQITEKQIKSYWFLDEAETKELTPNDVIAIQFYEDWRVDPVTLQMSKKLMAYTPIAVSKDASSGTYTEKRLFNVVTDEAALQKLKDNYPKLY